MMRKLKMAGCLLTLAMLATSCVTQPKFKTFSDYDKDTNFSDYRLFAWMTKDPLFVASMQPVNPSLQQSLMSETSTQLKALGFRRVSKPEDADFVVSFTIGSRDDLQENNYPSKYRQLATVGQSYPESSEVREVTTGAVAIEVFDQKSGQRTWTGWATTGLTMDVRADAGGVVKNMVPLILADFPPAS